MIRKIAAILQKKGEKRERTYSFEFFPPKTDKGKLKLFETAGVYAELEPDWFSVTYGAGGTTRAMTMEIADEIQKSTDTPVMHHFTCVGHSKSELKTILTELKRRNICNILALRGDAPVGEDWKPAPDGFEYCYQLIDMIHSFGGFFSIGVAGFPEGHINCPDKPTDSKYMKIKIDTGGEFIITQLFFENKDYFEYVDRIRKVGVTVPIIPGILPITDYQTLLRFCKTCGATIPQSVHDIFKPLDGDAEGTYKKGVEFAMRQCKELLKGGVPGLHFYTLNKVDPTREILNAVRV